LRIDPGYQVFAKDKPVIEVVFPEGVVVTDDPCLAFDFKVGALEQLEEPSCLKVG
jgi:hypothetical protein